MFTKESTFVRHEPCPECGPRDNLSVWSDGHKYCFGCGYYVAADGKSLDIMVLKNNKGVEENRVRHMDYSIQFNRLFLKRVLAGGNITLFSPHEVPDLMPRLSKVKITSVMK